MKKRNLAKTITVTLYGVKLHRNLAKYFPIVSKTLYEKIIKVTLQGLLKKESRLFNVTPGNMVNVTTKISQTKKAINQIFLRTTQT